MSVTDKLLEQIKNSRDIDAVLEQNSSDFINPDYAELLNNLLAQKNVSKSDVIKRANLPRTYAYGFFSGEKKPNRNNILQLCFGFELTFDETQSFLKASGFSPLYARNQRDSVIIYALENKMNIIDTNVLLDNHAMALLREEK